MLDEIVQTIPAQPGSYALWLHLPQTRNLTIGKLGRFTFRTGDYFYLGSAFGPGGEGYVRCSYATAYEHIEEALLRIEHFMHQHG